MLKWSVTNKMSQRINSSQNEKTDIEKLIAELENESNVDNIFTTNENNTHKDTIDNKITDEQVKEDDKYHNKNKNKIEETPSDTAKVIQDLEKEINVDHIFTAQKNINHKSKDIVNEEILDEKVKDIEKYDSEIKDIAEQPMSKNEQVIGNVTRDENIIDREVDWQTLLQNNDKENGTDSGFTIEGNKTPMEHDKMENENIDSLEEDIVEHKNMIDNKLDEILSSLQTPGETIKNESKSKNSKENENSDPIVDVSKNNEANVDLDKVLETLQNSIQGDYTDNLKENAVRHKKKFERRNSVNVDTNGFGKCAGCGNDLSDSALMVGTDYYHQGCFTCHKCGVNLAGKFFPVDGKNYCEKDWLDGLEKCSQCEKPMQTGSVNVNNKKYHPECFVCVICRNPLEGTFFHSPDGPLCENDYKESREKCFICGLSLTGRIVSALNNKYHPACFSCAICEKVLDGKPFLSEGTSIYCTNCYARLKGKQCYACGNGILSTKYKKAAVVTVNGRSYHQECVNCKDCGKNLKGQSVFSAGEDDLLCLDDHMRREKLSI